MPGLGQDATGPRGTQRPGRGNGGCMSTEAQRASFPPRPSSPPRPPHPPENTAAGPSDTATGDAPSGADGRAGSGAGRSSTTWAEGSTSGSPRQSSARDTDQAGSATGARGASDGRVPSGGDASGPLSSPAAETDGRGLVGAGGPAGDGRASSAGGRLRPALRPRAGARPVGVSEPVARRGWAAGFVGGWVGFDRLCGRGPGLVPWEFRSRWPGDGCAAALVGPWAFRRGRPGGRGRHRSRNGGSERRHGRPGILRLRRRLERATSLPEPRRHRARTHRAHDTAPAARLRPLPGHAARRRPRDPPRVERAGHTARRPSAPVSPSGLVRPVGRSLAGDPRSLWATAHATPHRRPRREHVGDNPTPAPDPRGPVTHRAGRPVGLRLC